MPVRCCVCVKIYVIIKSHVVGDFRFMAVDESVSQLSSDFFFLIYFFSILAGDWWRRIMVDKII